MAMKRMWTTCLLGVGMISSVGCTTAMRDAFFAETLAESKPLHKQTRDLIDKHDLNMTGQHKAMSPEAAAAIDKLRGEFEAEVKVIQQRANDVHSKVGEVVAKLTKTAIRVTSGFAGLPAGSSMVMLASDALAAEGKARVAEIAAEGKARVAEIAAKDKELQALLAGLTEETRNKLATTSQDTFDKLLAQKDNDAEFRATLQKELKLTAAEMEGLKGMSTEQILALIAAATAAAGAGVVGGKSGKSRAQGDVEKIKERLDAITTDAALHLPSPVAEVAVRHGTPPPKVG